MRWVTTLDREQRNDKAEGKNHGDGATLLEEKNSLNVCTGIYLEYTKELGSTLEYYWKNVSS